MNDYRSSSESFKYASTIKNLLFNCVKKLENVILDKWIFKYYESVEFLKI